MKTSDRSSVALGRRFERVLLRAILGVTVIALSTGCASRKQATYASPDMAVQDLVSALEPLNQQRLRDIFGPESDDLVSSGDAVADQNAAARFMEKYNQKHELVANADGSRTLEVGDNDWPFPVPLVEQKGAWSFDTEAGLDEILNRRIGDHELYTIQTCLAIVDAQREYAILDPDGDGVHEYAQKFLSTPGSAMHDGLYWETTSEEEPSPLGPLVAEAAAAGYRRGENNERVPFHGYYYRMLTSQGPHAPGGAYDYLVGEDMIGGFAVVAWPASYDNSGIMTFITNQDGVLYQRDLGSRTDSIAASMQQFDPGEGWTKVEATPMP